MSTMPEEYGPWNPGLSSQLTPELWSLCTIFRPENVFTTYAQALEFSDLTGLAPHQLVAFRPQRLALHEVLIRVIADYEIPDPEGSRVATLGINFRRMTQTILTKYLAERTADCERTYASVRAATAAIVNDELRAVATQPAVRSAAERPRIALRWLRRDKAEMPASLEYRGWEQIQRAISAWTKTSHVDDVTTAAAYAALIKVVGAIVSKHGRVWGEQDLLASLVTGLACNVSAATQIELLIEPLIMEAANAEGYRPLPAQARSIMLSTKGASASGKSTMRLLQRGLAARLGVSWSDFALISPDVFRRDLLDIDSLGDVHKYFGPFTSHEIEIVDRKLDCHLARKAQHNTSSHLLVDRFRFDSFDPDSEEHRELFSRLSKIRLIHYLFMLTPPHKTVERAWKRGLELGRYKAVDDLLAHNVEAYAGMRRFFLARALRNDGLNQHYEFVDNDVAAGEVPRTVAFARNGEMNILDVKAMLDFDRYRKIDVNARDASQVYPVTKEMEPEENLTFLQECVQRFPLLRLAHQNSGQVYARVEGGRVVWCDPDACSALDEGDTTRALRAVLPELFADAGRSSVAAAARYLDPGEYLTIGRWGWQSNAASPACSAGSVMVDN